MNPDFFIRILVRILIQVVVQIQILIRILVQTVIWFFPDSGLDFGQDYYPDFGQILIRIPGCILNRILILIVTKWNPQACLQEHEKSDGVHKGGVELEVDVCGADVVAGAQDPLPHQGGAHRVVQTKVFRNPCASATLCKWFKSVETDFKINFLASVDESCLYL